MIEHDVELLNLEECAFYSIQVFKNRKYWLNRDWGYTFGASTYLDNPLQYPTLARLLNPIVRETCGPLIYKVAEKLKELGIAEDVKIYDQTLAVPGFHIFDFTSNGSQGNIHIDEPYTRCTMPQDFSEPFSFTLMLEMPKRGGGMDYWPNISDEEMGHYEVDGVIPAFERVEYQLGRLYIHDGLTPHRIANFGDMTIQEYRMSLQGHGVKLEDGSTVIYF